MGSQNKRAHGVTPELQRDYATRTATRQAAFVLLYLQPGMNLLDVGCGPGTITIGLAKAISPGKVVGIDHDSHNIEEAKMLANEASVTNIKFMSGDALNLPFENEMFDAVFENNMFVHLSERASLAAAEIYRVLKPGGFFAARDANADAVVWSHQTELMKQFDRFFQRWHERRGSDISLGKKLPAIIRESGFTHTIKSLSADTKGDREATRSHAEIMISLLEGPLGQMILDKKWTEEATINRMKKDIRKWGEHPDAFFANVHVEVIGWKY